jgi:RecA/RadA recombinase
MSKSALMDRILKNSPTKLASVLSESVLFTERDVIPTNLPILNIAFSGSLEGGLAAGLTTFAGASKSFKTLLGLLCVKAYLDKYPEAICVFYDSEGGVTPEYLESNGIDTTRVVHVPIEHLEMLKFDMVKTLKEIERGDKVIMMIDSIGNTASLKELEDAEHEKTVAEMQRAKVMKGLFRMVTPSFIKKDVPCICIAHTYQTMEMFSRAVISGGTGIMYSSNQAFIISKAQEKDGTDLAGFKFTINIEKSRYVREKAKFPFVVKYGKGINKWSGLLDIALESGHVVKPKNGRYSAVDMSTGEFNEKGVKEDDTNSKEFWQPILAEPSFNEYIKTRYALSGQNFDEIDEEDTIDEVYQEEDE